MSCMNKLVVIAMSALLGLGIGYFLANKQPPSIIKKIEKVNVPYRFYEPPVHSQACFQIVWRSEERNAASVCKGGIACAVLPKEKNELGGTGVIYAPPPKDYNDERRLLILGHEVLHVLGANHD